MENGPRLDSTRQIKNTYKIRNDPKIARLKILFNDMYMKQLHDMKSNVSENIYRHLRNKDAKILDYYWSKSKDSD